MAPRAVGLRDVDVQDLRARHRGVRTTCRDQSQRHAGDGGLHHDRKRVVGAGAQRKHWGVTESRRGRSHGAVTAEQHHRRRASLGDHSRILGRVRRRPGGSRQGQELDLGQSHPRRRWRRAKPANLPQHARGDPEGIGGQQHPLHAQRPDGADDPQHHRGLLSVREDRCLRHYTPNVPARHRIRNNSNRAAGDHGSRMFGHRSLLLVVGRSARYSEYVTRITGVKSCRELHGSWPR